MTSFRARRLAAAAIATFVIAGAALAGAATATAATTPPAIVAGAPASASGYFEYNGLLYLSGVAEGDIYTSLFSYDGTTFTHLAGSPDGIGNLTVFGGELIITAVDDILSPPFDYVIFTYDGATFTQIPGGFVSPNGYVEVGGVLFFVADVGGNWGLWQFDGVSTSAVPGGAVDPRDLSSFDGILYFAGDADPTPAEDLRLFAYDPAVPLVDAAVVTNSPADPGPLVAFDGVAYLSADAALFTFDGATTFTPAPLVPAVIPWGLTVFDGKLYFSGEFAGDYSPYVFSGGVATKVPGGVATETLQYTVFDGDLYFSGWTDASPTLAVIHNGTASLVTGAPNYPWDLYVFGGRLYFSGDPVNGDPSQMYVLDAGVSVLAETGADAQLPALIALVMLFFGATTLAAVRARRV